MKNSKITQFIILTTIVVLAALSRLLPHPPNFTPVGAMALFGAAYFAKRWMGLLMPLVALWISDLVLNNVVYGQYYEGFVWLTPGFEWLYGSFALIAVLGFFTLRGNENPLSVWAKKIGLGNVQIPSLLVASLSASTIFFLVSNFGVWMSGLMYPKTIAGLGTCYAAAVPYFFNTLTGDLLFVGVLFGAYALMYKPSLTQQRVF